MHGPQEYQMQKQINRKKIHSHLLFIQETTNVNLDF